MYELGRMEKERFFGDFKAKMGEEKQKNVSEGQGVEGKDEKRI